MFQHSQILEITNDLNQEHPPTHENFVKRINQLSEMTKQNLRFLMAYDKQLYSNKIDNLYKTVNDRRSTDGTKIMGISEFQQKNIRHDSKRETETEIKKPKLFDFGGLKAVKKANKKNQVKQAGLENMVAQKEQPSKPIHEDTYSVENIRNKSQTVLINDEASEKNKNLLVDQIHGSTVQISHSPGFQYSSAKLRNISESTVYLGDTIKGPVYVENIIHSVIIVSDCQQLRMHDSSNTLVVVECESGRPIIEKCEGLVFAQAADLIDIHKKRWDTIDDFNWLVSDVPSKNWRPLKVELIDQVRQQVQDMNKMEHEKLDIDDILRQSFN